MDKFQPNLTIGFLKARDVVGPNARFASGLLTTHNVIGPTKDLGKFWPVHGPPCNWANHGSRYISACCRPVNCLTQFRPNLLFSLLKAHGIFWPN
jgi:hypothetical protein